MEDRIDMLAKTLLTVGALSLLGGCGGAGVGVPMATATPVPTATSDAQVVAQTLVLDNSPKTLDTIDVPAAGDVTIEVVVTQAAGSGFVCGVPTIWDPEGNRVASPKATETTPTGARYLHTFSVAQPGTYVLDLHNVDCDEHHVNATAHVTWRIVAQ